MARDFGHLSDEELRSKRAELEAEQARLEAIGREYSADLALQKSQPLAYSHRRLVVSREVLAVSQTITSISVEQSLRANGTWKQTV